jgi:uncharacterized membrane protein
MMISPIALFLHFALPLGAFFGLSLLLLALLAWLRRPQRGEWTGYRPHWVVRLFADPHLSWIACLLLEVPPLLVFGWWLPLTLYPLLGVLMLAVGLWAVWWLAPRLTQAAQVDIEWRSVAPGMPERREQLYRRLHGQHDTLKERGP